MNSQPQSLKARLLVFSLAIAITPIAILTWRTMSNAALVKADIVHSFETHAVNTIDIVERNLFERYGDVQAFAANESVLNREQWGKRSDDENGIIRAMNSYMDLYDIYSIMLAVDLEGNPIAANSRDANGNSVDNTWIYSENFKDEPWFRKALAGEFLEGDGTSGTVVEDVHPDSLVQKAIGGDGLAISYSAPIKDAGGNTIGLWSNRVSITLLTDILEDSYRSLNSIGLATAELTLLDSAGRVIVELDPSSNGGNIESNTDKSIILNLNLANNKVAAAQAAVKGETGAIISEHADKGVKQVSGYAHSQGALGYKGLDWSVLVRINEDEALDHFIDLNRELVVIVALSLLIVFFVAWKLSNKIANPLIEISLLLSKNADHTQQSSLALSQSAQGLADGSTEQAANLEETSASSEELSAMTAQNAENVSKALDEVRTATRIVETANLKLSALSQAMNEISSANDETKNIVKTIDEIAFQTNILALNAAVEAARAGEAGAGFAIVADEVRNLAGRAAQAAQSTSSLLDQNIAKISIGTRSLNETNEGFNQLIKSTQKVSRYMGEIHESTKEQSLGLSQINTAVSQISDVTQQNASGAEEVASAAKELDYQSSEISESVTRLLALVSGSSNSTPNPRTNLNINSEKSFNSPNNNRLNQNDHVLFN